MKISEIKYQRPDIEAIKERCAQLFSAFDDAASAEEQLKIYNEFVAINETVSTQQSLAYIRFTLDTRDEFYSREIDWMNENSPVLAELGVVFQKKMLESKFRPELEKALAVLRAIQ